MSCCLLLCRGLFAALFFLMTGIFVSAQAVNLLAAERPAEAQQPSTTEYRRLFVPADAPETWPVESERFLPIPHKDFLRLIEQNETESQGKEQLPMHVSKAIYRAKVLPNHVLGGTTEWTIEGPGKQSRLLPLSPLNLAIRSAFWRRDRSLEAAVGLWKREDAPRSDALELAVLAEQVGTLVMQWQLAAEKIDSTGAVYDLQKPIVVPQKLELDLPAYSSATLTHAQLLRTETRSPGESRWHFQLAPHETHQLRIERPTPVEAVRVLPFVSQVTSYQLTPSGLNVHTQLRFDARESQNIELQAELPSGLKVMDVDIDQQPVAWRVVDNTGDNAGEATLVISRPESRQPQLIEIRCLANIRSDTLWVLPKFRFDEVAWTEGTTSLFVSPELEVRWLIPKYATLQHIVGIADRAREGEVFRLQEWSQDAEIEMEVGRLQPRLSVQSLTTIELGREEAQATIAATLSNSGSDLYQVQATVAADWAIDSVTTTPTSTLNGWHLDREGNSAKLYVQLNQPITGEQPLHLEIKVREATGKSVLPATVGQLKLLRFQGKETPHEWLQLRTRESQQGALTDRLERLRLQRDEELPTAFRSLATESPGGTLLEISLLDEAEVLEFRQQPAQYKADLQIEVDTFSDSLRHQYRIECRVLEGAVSEIVFEVEQPLPANLQWSLVNLRASGPNASVVMERFDAVGKESSNVSAATYALRFPVAMTDDFRLQASYSRSAQPIEHCNLMRLLLRSADGVPDEAQTLDWSGHVLLRGSLVGLHVLDQGWTPTVALPPDASDDLVSSKTTDEQFAERLPVLGTYRIGPEEFRRSRAAAGLRLERQTTIPSPPKNSAPQLVAWLAEYHTLQAADGAALHSANYSLENMGSVEATVVLPEGAELQEAWLDSQQLDLKLLSSDDNTYRFRFDRELRWPYLALKYSTHKQPLAGSASLQPAVPKCSFPVNLGRWTLWAPEQYEFDNTQRIDSSQKTHWWKRLFGPLARSRGETVFNPLRGTHWTQLWSAPLVGQQTKLLAEKMARQLAERLAANPDLAMGQLVRDLTDQYQVAEKFYIDRAALLVSGVQAETPGRFGVASDRAAHSLRVEALPLSSYRLALLVSPGTIVLTTSERVAHWHDQLRPIETPGVFLVSSDGLADRFDEIRNQRSADIVDVTQWLLAPPTRTPQWKPPVAMTLADVGRQAQTVKFIGRLPTLKVRRAYVRQAFWYALVLLTLVLGVWQLARYPNVTILAISMAGAACLVVPTTWLALPQAIFLGLIAAAIVRVVVKSSRYGDDHSLSLRKVAQATALLVFLCLPNLQTQAQPPNVSNGEQNLPRVLVPIDAQGSPQGKDVYLSEEFLKRLQEVPRQIVNEGAELVILAANYRGSLPGEFHHAASSQDRNLTDPWTLRWKVKSFVPNSRLFLPLRRDEAQWNATLHRLDGLPIKLDWQPDGKGCSVIFPETGIHWLQLVAQPRLTLNDPSALLRLHVPPLAGATLDLVLTPNIENLHIPAASQIATSNALDPWRGLLRAKDVLELHWTSKAASNNGTSWESLEQSAWLHVDPAAARLDVQLTLTEFQAASRILEFEVSPQLKLEPPEENSPIAEVLAPSPNQPTRLQVKLRPGLPDDLVLSLRFEFQRAVSVGRIFYPRVRLLGSPPVQNLFAVSVSAGLSYDEQDSTALRGIEPTEFSKSWNAPAAEPLFAYSLGQEDPEWSLHVRPDPKSLTAQQTLRVYCLPNVARVDFEAVIDELSGTWLSHRLELPESLHIETITVRDTDEQSSVPVRWSRVNATEAVVFLGRPLRHAHMLQLQGHVNATRENEIELPQIRLLDGDRSTIHMDLYRTEEVQVSWADSQLAPPEIPEQRIARSSEEIHIGHFAWRSSQASPRSKIRVERNDQKFDTTSVTSVQLGPDGWVARLNTRVNVRKGVVSRLSLTVPSSFHRSFDLLPNQVGAIEEVRETPRGNVITLSLTQPVTAGDHIDIQLSGSLNLPADQRLVIPSLTWNGASRRERYVLLPKFVEQQSLHWQTNGLRRQALPPQLRVYASKSEATPYFVEQSQFEAKELTDRGTLHNALVRYAKVTGILDSEGVLTATAELVLQPGRATSCAIQLPPQSQLCQLVVGDRPVRRDPREDGSWKVPVGPPFMPQRIVVNYRSQPKLNGKRLWLVPPSIFLGDQALPIAQTWWNIRTTRDLRLNKPSVGRFTSRIEFVKNSYQQPQLVLEEALSQALDLPHAEGRAWAQTWQSITQQAEQNWQAYALLEGVPLDLSKAENTQSGFNEIYAETLSEAFATDGTAPARRQLPLTYPPRLPGSPEASPEQNEHFFVSDSQGQLVLAVSQGSPRNLWRWFAATALVCGILAIVLKLRRNPRWHYDLCHWPHSLALIGGVVWWLLLEPSVMGMFVIVLALVSLALKRGRSLRQHRLEKLNRPLTVPTS